MDLLRMTLAFLSGIVTISGFNTDTTSYGTLASPKKDLLFGYTVVATGSNGSLTLWSGSPKFSNQQGAEGGSKAGAIYRCSITTQERDINQHCEKINLKPIEEDKKKNSTESNDDENSLPGTALETCPFTNSTCGYTTDNEKIWLTKNEYGTKPKRQKYVTRSNRHCYSKTKLRTRLTGPPGYTVHEGLIALDSDGATRTTATGRSVTSTLVSQLVETRPGINQCLRFCYNAYSLLDSSSTGASRRSLRVLLQYENSAEEIFVYSGPKDIASKHWNFTEINIVDTAKGDYKVVFEVTVFKNKRVRCAAAADIVLTDISVSNAACEDEPDDIDILDSEQSVGISLQVKYTDNDGPSVITACGPLWQKNCGYAKEAAGICYEMTSNTTRTVVKTLHNPATAGCIRGKIDVVLLVDQSGSVNQCNFQKVKQWLRNIVRGFTVGPHEQDIGIVLYSSEDKTKKVFELGFERHNNNGDEKKKKMLADLKKLEFPAGGTYTGLAFKHANDMLWGPFARPDAKKMVILLTDGDTTPADKGNLQKQVKFTRGRNATILAVGVADYNASELINISGSERNFFPVKDFSQLELVRDKLRESVSHSVLEGSHDHDSDSGSMQNCQMGFSLHYGEGSLLMGSPGCHNRAGDVIKYNTDAVQDRNNGSKLYEHTQTEIPNINQTTFATYTEGSGDFELFLGTTVASLIQNGTQPYDNFTNTASHDGKEGVTDVSNSFQQFEIPSFAELERVLNSEIEESYFGYDVTSGYYRGAEMEEFAAASAPRHNGTGAVLIYQTHQGDKIKNDHALTGMQLGEYFGASICSLDINSDGYTDLFVAAPLHSANNPDEGRVYMYMGGQELPSKPDAILKGSGAAFSRFGSSINTVGDLNLDGYEDIVISSPDEDDHSGAVYVFHGSTAGIHEKYVQRISASQLEKEKSLTMFGQSVVGGLDVDGNGYPDLLISAPGSDVIVILKTRPVVHITSEFRITTPLIDRKNDLCWQQTDSTNMVYERACIACSVCFAFSGLAVPSGVAIHYDIFADANMSTARVGLYEAQEGGRTLHSDMTLSDAGTMMCRNHTLYLKKNIRDLMTEMVLLLTFDMEEFSHEHDDESTTTSGIIASSDALIPILDIHTLKERDASALFKTYCEDTSSCVADISVTASGPVNSKGKSLAGYEVSEEKVLRFKVEVENSGPEEAHAVVVTVKFSNALIYNSLSKTTCFKFMEHSEADKDGIQLVTMALTNTLLAVDEKCSGVLVFLASSLMTPEKLDHLILEIDATTVSIDNRTENNKMVASLPVKYQAEFALLATSFPNAVSSSYSNLTNDSDATTSFRHVYKVTNVGPTGLKGLNMTLQWPICIEQNDIYFHVKYSENKFCSRLQGTCKSLSTVNETLSDDRDICSRTVVAEEKCQTKSTTLCKSMDIVVAEFPVHESLEVTVKADAEMVANLTAQIFITSALSLSIAQRDVVTFPSGQDFTASATTSVYPQPEYTEVTKVDEIAGLPYWVYILSVGVGLLLLLIVIIVCRQLGFFNSKYAEKKKVAQEDMLYSSEMVPMNVET